MSKLTIPHNRIPAMIGDDIEKIRLFESICAARPQQDIETLHVLHGGMYARTIMLPSGVVITGALIKIATMLIIQGDVVAYIGESTLHLVGYHVIPASAHRKQAFVARTDTYMTMIFPSAAERIDQAEDQFTDEADMLISRKRPLTNKVIITGE